MKICGFSFVKDAVKYDYPIVEAIRSILPVCDEFVILVGKSEDGTLERIRKINEKKLKVIETVWDQEVSTKGRILAQETDKAFSHIGNQFDWAFYIQADEIVHEKYHSTIYDQMLLHKDNKNIDGLLFKYLHFYGSYDYVGASSGWYHHEIRIIRNDKNIYSYRDAQGFRKRPNEKLRVAPIDAYIYHYGWVREPKAMSRKLEKFHEYYEGKKIFSPSSAEVSIEFDYKSGGAQELKPFEGTHPLVMKERIAQRNWSFAYDISYSKKSLKDKFKIFCKKYLGLNFYYQNYIIAKANR